MSNLPEIDIFETQKRVADGAVLVDVREQNEYDEAHIPEAKLIPLSEFTSKYDTLPKDKPLIMQCRSGARSAQATQYLLDNGYEDVVNMTGGILAWQQAELPLERSEG